MVMAIKRSELSVKHAIVRREEEKKWLGSKNLMHQNFVKWNDVCSRDKKQLLFIDFLFYLRSSKYVGIAGKFINQVISKEKEIC